MKKEIEKEQNKMEKTITLRLPDEEERMEIHRPVMVTYVFGDFEEVRDIVNGLMCDERTVVSKLQILDDEEYQEILDIKEGRTPNEEEKEAQELREEGYSEEFIERYQRLMKYEWEEIE